MSDKEILMQFGEALIQDIRRIMPRVSGATAEGLIPEATETTLTIFAPNYIGALEYGRKPTGKGGGAISLYEKIKEWVRRKPVVPRPGLNGKIPTLSQLAYMITRSIHQRGTRAYIEYKSSGRGTGILSSVITEKRINSLVNVFAEKYSATFTSEVLKSISK